MAGFTGSITRSPGATNLNSSFTAGEQLNGIRGAGIDDLLSKVMLYKKFGNRQPPTFGNQDPYEKTMKDLAMKRAVAETQAETQAPPMKYNFMQGTTGPFQTLNTDAMTGAQRQRFLPQNAGVAGRFGEEPAPEKPLTAPQPQPPMGNLDSIRMFYPSLYAQMLGGRQR